MTHTSPRPVLVTGATGFTGSYRVHALVRDGVRVRVIARSAETAAGVLPPGVEVIEGNITDPETVTRAVTGTQTTYHIAAAFREAKYRDTHYWDVNVGATHLLLDAAGAAGVERFVHCSTVGIHGHVANPPADEEAPFGPGDIYQRTKLEGEALALRYARDGRLAVSVGRRPAFRW